MLVLRYIFCVNLNLPFPISGKGLFTAALGAL